MSHASQIDSPCETIVSESSVESLLLVEDDDALRTCVAKVLSRSGFLVIEATDGAGALSLLRSMGSTLEWLITDLRLGEISGMHVAFEFRYLHPTRPIVFISGYELPIEIERMRDVVALRKPFSSDDLLNVMGSLRSEKHAADTLGM